MTEQERTIREEGTIAYLRLVEEIVREHFDALDTSGSVEEGGFGSQREAAEGDLKKHLDLWELEGALNDTDQLLEGFWHVAQVVNPVALIAVSDARERVRAALERVQEFIRAESE
jgi:hypothetical protein